MATRREKVVLELDDGGFSTQMAKNAAATLLLERALKHLDGTSVHITERISQSSREVDRLSTSATRADGEINKLSGRLRVFADAAAILGPGALAIAAVGIPAVGGLANGLAATVLGAGTAVLAFQGVGDALKAVNKAALEPTAQNLEQARFALEQLSPAAAEFVVELRRMEPALDRLKSSAAAGLFPGVADALDTMKERLPAVDRLLFRIGDTLGNLSIAGADSLAGPEWDDFFHFIGTEAPEALAALGHTVGDLAHGLAELWMAFTPLNHDFASVMTEAAASFDGWASGLAKTEGFQDFVAYLRENGPRVGDALAAIGDALLQIVQASAPLGGPVLDALTAIARVMADIADSDAGPAIMGTVTALALLNRGTRAFEAIGSRPWVQAAKNADTFTGKLSASRGALLKTTGAVAGLAAASSGLGDSLGLSNTISLALLGTLGGPWGAAVGGAIGLMMDFGASHDYTSASSEDLQSTLNQETGAVTRNTEAYVANKLEKSGALKAGEELGLNLGDITKAAMGNADAMARVKQGLDDAKAGFYDANGYTVVGADVLEEYRGNLEAVTGGIDDVSGKLTSAQGRQRRYAAATGLASDETRKETAALRSNVAAFNRKVHALGEAFDAETQYRQALKDAEKQGEKNNRGIQGSSKAALNNRNALAGLRDAWNNQSQAVKNNLNRYDEARRSFIRVAESMGVPREAAIKLANKMLDIPTNIHTKVTADTGSALSALAQARRELEKLDGKVANTYIRTIRTGAGGTDGNKTFHYATGGWTGPGPRLEPRGVVHADEVVLPKYVVRRDARFLKSRYGFLPGMDDLPGYADGGVVGSQEDRPGSLRGGPIRAAEHALARLTHQIELSTKSLDAERQQRDKIRSAMQELSSGIADTFTSSPFGRDSGWGGGGGWEQALMSDISGGRAFLAAEKTLRDKGLNQKAFEYLVQQGPEAVEQMAALSRRRIDRFEDLYAIRQRVARRAGRYAAEEVYGHRFDVANDRLADIRDDIHDLKLKQRQSEKHLKHMRNHGAKEAGDHFAKGLNGAGNHGRRKAKKW